MEAEEKPFESYPYNWNALKLLCSINGDDASNYKQFYKAKRCFTTSSDYFKLNLYPVGFADTEHGRWQQWHTTLTGLPNKASYLEWCANNRFPVIRNWMREFSHKLIVCTGMSLRGTFLAGFGVNASEAREDTTTGKQIVYGLANERKTLVVVTYFLGRSSGLKSNRELTATGRRLAELQREAIPA